MEIHQFFPIALSIDLDKSHIESERLSSTISTGSNQLAVTIFLRKHVTVAQVVERNRLVHWTFPGCAGLLILHLLVY